MMLKGNTTHYRILQTTNNKTITLGYVVWGYTLIFEWLRRDFQKGFKILFNRLAVLILTQVGLAYCTQHHSIGQAYLRPKLTLVNYFNLKCLRKKIAYYRPQQGLVMITFVRINHRQSSGYASASIKMKKCSLTLGLA